MKDWPDPHTEDIKVSGTEIMLISALIIIPLFWA